MTSREIRQSFMDFFKSKEHRIVQSAPVAPHGDPTLLFTNAGMNQFKDVFLGFGKRDYVRAADTQKCIRVSGKHNDLEEVGRDTYHHTFFEMLGNWSFGDYYKAEAIDFCWELLTEVWKLPKERLHATVFRTDDEAYEMWKKYLPESQIQRFNEKDNFWEMGESGPCGPCSEVHFDRTPDLSGAKLVNAGVPEVIEIWNLVFIQYNRKADGSLEELSSKHVDTGMGFERICAVIQGKGSNYDTDVFMPLLNEIEKISGKKYSTELENADGIAMRVIADHIRTLSFAIADGAMPGNDGRGYVLRRILRRAARFARSLGIQSAVMYRLLPVLIESMGDIFPELIEHRDIIEKIIRAEEESFLQTLDRGLNRFEDVANNLGDSKMVSGADAFLLFDSFGFPLDLTELIAREKGLEVDTAEFTKLMKEQKERSRSARKSTAQEVEEMNMNEKSEFVGYETYETEAKILWVKDNLLVLDKTPFYAESGGQSADNGAIALGGEIYHVGDVKKYNDAIIHVCDKDVEPLVGDIALAKIDVARRRAIMRNHSATHLMNEALTQVLGSHVKQSGSLVAPDYLRFDFSHFEKVSAEQLAEVERIVNEKIYDDIQVEIRVLPIEEAQKNSKTKMFFGDKYGDIVRIVIMDEKFSMEFCGGAHVKNTSDIGGFKIISESSIASGIRRIEAITGAAIYKYILNQNEVIVSKDGEIDGLKDKIKALDKKISNYQLIDVYETIKDQVANAPEVEGCKAYAGKVNIESPDQLKTLADKILSPLGAVGVGLLATIIDGKILLACIATDGAMKKYPAGKIIGVIAKELGGGGGGKPSFATAGGKDIDKLDEVLANFATYLK